MTAANSRLEVHAPDSEARSAARARIESAAAVRGSHGRLDELAIWGAGVQRRCPPDTFATPVLMLLVREDSEAAVQHADDLAREHPLVMDLARMHGVATRVIPVPVDASLAFDAGRDAADREVDAGADLVIPVLLDADALTSAAALVGLFTRIDASGVTEFASGGDDADWMARCADVRDAMRAGRSSMGDPIAVLTDIDAGPLAALTGVLLQSAARATPAMIDGPIACAAALVASRTARAATSWWVAASSSGHRALARGLDHLEIPIVTDLGIADDAGVAAVTALPVLQSAMVSLRV